MLRPTRRAASLLLILGCLGSFIACTDDDLDAPPATEGLDGSDGGSGTRAEDGSRGDDTSASDGSPSDASTADVDATDAAVELDASDAAPDASFSLPPQRLAVGDEHACLVDDVGHVRCWGRNNFGQLGYGDTQTRGDAPGEIEALVDIDIGGMAVAVAAGWQHSCVLLTDGKVRCWGKGSALGYGMTTNRGDVPGTMPPPAVDLGGGSARQIVTSRDDTCALMSNGDVRCWGDDTGATSSNGAPAGKLGLAGVGMILGDGPGEMPPAPLVLPGPAVALTAAQDAFCALLESGGVTCWGSGEHGVVGSGSRDNIGDDANEWPPPLVSLGSIVVSSIAGGGHVICVRSQQGGVYCWGRNDRYTIGGSTDAALVIGGDPGTMPPPVLPLGALALSSLRLGFNHACGLTAAGAVHCWGINSYGNVGVPGQAIVGDQPGEFPDLTAVDIGPGDPAVELGLHSGAGGLPPYFTCARLASGKVRCWGRNSRGQLALGNTTNLTAAPSTVSSVAIFGP
jgi:alpha-tubulin suppressor-like RCC1 family protein